MCTKLPLCNSLPGEKRALIFGPKTLSAPVITIKVIGITETVNVTIRAPKVGLNVANITVKPGMEFDQSIGQGILVHTSKEKKLVEIESTGPIMVLGIIRGSDYIDAVHARLLSNVPCDYIVPLYDDSSSTNVLTAGTLDDDNEIKVKQPVSGGSFEEVNSMETFTVTSMTVIIGGSEVKSTEGKLIVVYSGAECNQIPSGVGNCDYIWSPATSNCELGLEHVVVPIEGRAIISGYVVRVFATSDGTTVELYDEVSSSFTALGTADEKGFVELTNPPTTEALYIKCSQNCVVVQLNKGNNADGSTTGPFMMPVPSLDQYVHTAVIRSLSKTGQSYVNIVTNTPLLKDLHISMCSEGNEEPMKSQDLCSWKAVNGLSQYQYCSFSVDSINEIPIILADTSGSGLFAVWVYGHEPPKSGYGYLANDWNSYGRFNLYHSVCLN